MQKILQALLKWSPSSAGAAITLHALWQHQWTQGAIAFGGTAILSLFTAYSDKFTAILKQAVEQRGERDARWVLRKVGGVGFGDRYRQSLIYTYRTTRTQGFDLAPFKPDLEQVYVPLRVQTNSLPQLSAAMIQPERSIEALSIWQFLSAAPSSRIALIGPPGSGKSTLLEHLALTYARRQHRQQHSQAPDRIPVLLYLRDWREAIAADSPPTLVQLIEQQVQRQPSDRPLVASADWFAARLAQGDCLVMLDGLDEVADSAQRQKVARWVNQQMQSYVRSPFILTSRPFGYDSVKTDLPQINVVLGIQPFHWHEVAQFITRWYRENESKRQARAIDPGIEQAARHSAADLLRRIQTNPPLAAMAVNPLLLTMIATVHCYRGALPGRRVELYAEICDVLLGRRQAAKGLSDRLSSAQKQTVLQVLALKGMQRSTREFKLVTACLLIRQRLIAVAGIDADPIEFLQSIERVSGLLVQREQDVYEFAHKSLQEYLAAKQIKEIHQEMLLARHIDDPWWEETIRLFAAQTDASYLIQTAIDRNTVRSLAIAYDCLKEGLRIDPSVRKSLEVAIEKGLESTNAEIFKLAAEVKLSRRLKNLLRIDEKTEIDTSYITCAEYQLFIDEKRSVQENHQPDHWKSRRFAPGDATKPIAGVRASDAIEFCDWLTARSSRLGDVYEEGGDRIFVGEYKYRIPVLAEAEEHSIGEGAIGCWSMVESEFVKNTTDSRFDSDQLLAWKQVTISGVDPHQLKIWKQHLAELLDHDFNLARAVMADLEPELDFSRNLIRIVIFNFDLALALALDRTLTSKALLDQTQVQAANLGLDLDRISISHQLLRSTRTDLGFAYAIWSFLSAQYERPTKNFSLRLRRDNITRKGRQEQNSQYLANAHQAIRLLIFAALIQERQENRMPAWEGIRIVRQLVK